MSDIHSIENDFLNKVTEIIEENITDESFGVSELAEKISMSRSNLLRKIKKQTNLSASRFIRQIRLKNAMELLREASLNVSGVSYKVGFNSTSYFIKCFHEHYGYPPGEVGKRNFMDSSPDEPDKQKNKKAITISAVFFVFIISAVILFVFIRPFSTLENDSVKSIAVLPFINNSDDSSNVYIINGLMESILNNLQKIEDLRVISRTSVEKYRNDPKTIPQIAEELNVSYLLEGSGQKIGDQIMLNVQLIKAKGDKHIWSEQYNRKAKDVFSLQNEIAKNIAEKIEVIITPEEEKRIEKVPTENLIAYDFFLKGLDQFYKGGNKNMENAIINFRQAIEYDSVFARAYAGIAISYYLLDVPQTEKKYSDSINLYSDKALLFDPQSPQSLIAKAFFYMHSAKYELAIPYLEKALKYNPNSALVINTLADFYTSYLPNTEKYLEYALKGIRLDIAAYDSVTASYIYLHVSNAFIQSGFIDEAEIYINKSLEFNPDNLYSEYVKAFILYSKDKDLYQTKELLIETLHKDTTRLDILQEVGKIYYYMRDYESSYKYYKKFINIKETYNLNIYRHENAKIGLVLAKMGLTEESNKYFEDYRNYGENDKSIYKHLSLSVYYSYKGDTERALEQIEIFSQQYNYHYWIVLFLPIDPLLDNINDLS
ncbi:MAG: helix-turn-helix domain-containing protein [Bacteroidales bacterium]|nr:helix-turn-helix domain-containing protein [Bacteroidales bacterium]